VHEVADRVDDQLADLEPFLAERFRVVDSSRAACAVARLFRALEVQLVRNLIAGDEELSQVGDSLPQSCIVNTKSARRLVDFFGRLQARSVRS
jgi:hypothetical protein